MCNVGVGVGDKKYTLYSIKNIMPICLHKTWKPVRMCVCVCVCVCVWLLTAIRTYFTRWLIRSNSYV